MEPKFVDLEGPRKERIPIRDFLTYPPFPGHRNAEERANRAEHLFKLLPEHTRVDLAECAGQRYRLTGNTRAEVWKCGRSDQVPEFVNADIYDRETLEEVRELGTHFDSREAAWSVRDHAYRAIGIAFGDQWRPTTTIGRSNSLAAAVRQAHVYRMGYYSTQHGRGSIQQTELVMPEWTEEIQLLDALLDTPTDFGDKRETNPFRVPHMAAYLLLFKYVDNAEKVAAFLRAGLKNEGVKESRGMDGIFLLTDTFSSRIGGGRGGARSGALEIVEKILGAWMVHDAKMRILSKNAKVDPVDFCKGRGVLKGARQAPVETEGRQAPVETDRELEAAE